MSAFLALALAVPALGGPSNPVADISASAKKVAKKANKKAKKANQNAKSAQNTADQALSDAGDAQSSANNAQSSADGAQSSADAAQAAADAAQASADSKLENTSQVTGTTSANNGTSPKLVSAGCPAGAQITGGGYTIGGTAPDTAAPQLEFAYSDDWLVQAQEIDGTTPGNWSLVAFAECATTG